ncbi:MAG: tetratricopeptide repeat protein [Caldithrix sp.]|nr:tetratricopeptide repeat protein [Caldithrix sp.]
MKRLQIMISTMLIGLLIIVSACSWGKKETDRFELSDMELLEMGNNQLEAGDYKKAIESYQTLMTMHPTSDLHIDARMRMAEAYGKMDEFERQMDILLQTLKENIIPGRVPEIYIQIGQFYERAANFNPGTITSDTADYKEAIKYYELATNYTDSDDKMAKSEALFRRALVESKIGEVNKAIKHYEMITQQYPQQPYSLLAQVKLQNPQNPRMLSIHPDSLENYRSMMGAETLPTETTKDESEDESFDPHRQELGDETDKSVEESVMESTITDTLENKE